MKFQPNDHKKAIAYVGHWYWTMETLELSSGRDSDFLSEFMASGCIPGAIYGVDEHQNWWSALAAYMGKTTETPQGCDQLWYSPAALRWIRKSILFHAEGMSFEDISKAHETHFVREFCETLSNMQSAIIAYPAAFDTDSRFHGENAQLTAKKEWAAWISGAYGVCLRDFTAASCIRKEVLAAQIKAHFDPQQTVSMAQHELLDAVSDLASLITPFSPWERKNGTPGRTIDRVLDQLKLGRDFPYPSRQEAALINLD